MPKPRAAVLRGDFTSTRTAGNPGYAAVAERMVELAAEQPGFLAVESAREEVGISVSYWQDLASITGGKRQTEHRKAQRLGREH